MSKGFLSGVTPTRDILLEVLGLVKQSALITPGTRGQRLSLGALG